MVDDQKNDARAAAGFRIAGGALRCACWLLIVLASSMAAAAGTNDTSPSEFFEKQVRPILAEKCQSCHGEKKARSGFRLLSREWVLKGGDFGPAVVPGKPEKSLLIEAVEYLGDLQMPPSGKLSDAEIATLKRWIALGVPWPKHGSETAAGAEHKTVKLDEAKRWWAFQPIRSPTPPAAKNHSWAHSEIDRFILAELEHHGIMPAPAAEKRTLIRRATFDLTGLPPSADEINAFLADASPDAFAKVVDRLLASQAYGERWARHWLDVARYADSIQVNPKGQNDSSDFETYESYRYRDWVVESFNKDMPFDQFIVHQIAGDCLPNPAGGEVYPEGLTASGFLALGVWDFACGDKQKVVSDIVDDQIDVVGKAFLGLTLSCARCHDHKFDPISTADYYGLAGIFYSSRVIAGLGENPGPTILDRRPLVPADYLKKQKQHAKKLSDLERKIGQMTAEAVAKSTVSKTASKQIVLPNLSDELLSLCKQRNELAKVALPPPPLAIAAEEGGVPGGLFPGVQDVPVHIRGSYSRLGSVVPRHFPVVLAGEHQQPIAQGSGRLELARWIASKNNPLTARVLVNRLWMHHFGEGIVRTPNNFGKLGELPSHPELLDWLASRLIADGWSIKTMQRRIMLSAAYQRASSVSDEQFSRDIENRWFGRMNARRLEAEAIRDAILAVSHGLDRKMGGPAVLDVNEPRRSLYVQTARRERANFVALFDAANPDLAVDKRSVSTVAPQALFFLNDTFVWRRARNLAQELDSAFSERDARIEEAYRKLFGRPAQQHEIRLANRFLDQAASSGNKAAWVDYIHALLCSNEFVYID